MPDNPKLDEVYKRKLVEFADLTPDEVSEIMEYESKKMTMPPLEAGNAINGQPNVSMQTPVPQQILKMLRKKLLKNG
jgi:hypothetical protein